jgi:hypothetical protein
MRVSALAGARSPGNSRTRQRASRARQIGWKVNGKLQFMKDETQHVIFTGSAVLINQLEKYGKEIPFLATVRKIERYYTLS